jgi:hypothetical protein
MLSAFLGSLNQKNLIFGGFKKSQSIKMKIAILGTRAYPIITEALSSLPNSFGLPC